MQMLLPASLAAQINSNPDVSFKVNRIKNFKLITIRDRLKFFRRLHRKLMKQLSCSSLTSNFLSIHGHKWNLSTIWTWNLSFHDHKSFEISSMTSPRCAISWNRSTTTTKTSMFSYFNRLQCLKMSYRRQIGNANSKKQRARRRQTRK